MMKTVAVGRIWTTGLRIIICASPVFCTSRVFGVDIPPTEGMTLDKWSQKSDLGLLAGDLEGGMAIWKDWQNLSICISESVITGETRVTTEVTNSQEAAENTAFSSRRTTDFRHLGLWP